MPSKRLTLQSKAPDGSIADLKALNLQFERQNGKKPTAYIETYGCQQNEADSECIMGILSAGGYCRTYDKSEADLIIINTCAVREHAELRALSNTGVLKHLKEQNPNLIIGMCGCMIQQEHRTNDIKHKYPYVDFVFGTNMTQNLAQFVYAARTQEGRGFFVEDYGTNPGDICEDLPVKRESGFKALVTVMYGCNNFCSYCVVPYVRGRERSRKMEIILQEIKGLVSDGYREIMLLGQNVNSYGKDLYGRPEFNRLLREIDAIEGDFWVRFMSSHPKDATAELVDTISESPKIANHFHLPMQSGSDAILKAMNRSYTRESYFKYIDLLREKVPDISITSDFIVGFPGETQQDFEMTLDAIQRAQFDQIYAFIYSKRRGTPAERMENQIPEEVKRQRINRLLECQQEISAKKNLACVGKTLKVLVEGPSKNDAGMLTGRSYENKLVHFLRPEGSQDLTGQFVNVKIEECNASCMKGKLI